MKRKVLLTLLQDLQRIYFGRVCMNIGTYRGESDIISCSVFCRDDDCKVYTFYDTTSDEDAVSMYREIFNLVKQESDGNTVQGEEGNNEEV